LNLDFKEIVLWKDYFFQFSKTPSDLSSSKDMRIIVSKLEELERTKKDLEEERK
jgi:hypothetical protein